MGKITFLFRETQRASCDTYTYSLAFWGGKRTRDTRSEILVHIWNAGEGGDASYIRSIRRFCFFGVRFFEKGAYIASTQQTLLGDF